ncbi:hypothetical protein GQ472_00685 [archaeon]|nr:hypothetical protein [archaeon]
MNEKIDISTRQGKYIYDGELMLLIQKLYVNKISLSAFKDEAKKLNDRLYQT